MNNIIRDAYNWNSKFRDDDCHKMHQNVIIHLIEDTFLWGPRSWWYEVRCNEIYFETHFSSNLDTTNFMLDRGVNTRKGNANFKTLISWSLKRKLLTWTTLFEGNIRMDWGSFNCLNQMNIFLFSKVWAS